MGGRVGITRERRGDQEELGDMKPEGFTEMVGWPVAVPFITLALVDIKPPRRVLHTNTVCHVALVLARVAKMEGG